MDFVRRNIDVLVIGCGGAGLRAAIEAHAEGSRVLILGKRNKTDAHTVLAAGGINASFGNLDLEDNWKQHFADTYLEGYKIGNPEIIEIMCKYAPELVLEIDKWGVDFAKLEDGKLDQRYFGAHTFRRTCYVGDYTGKAILDALVSKAFSMGIEIQDNFYVTDLLVDNGTCFGCLAFNTTNAKKQIFISKSVVLATGGHTRIWKRSSSRKYENNGDGFSLALNAGCSLIDMEMVQFHPTGMLYPENHEGTLVTEAVRGEGGRLINAKGERFMYKYDKYRMELSTRDRVAIANYNEIMQGNATKHGGVYLDISHKERSFILEKLPSIHKQFLELQSLDISKEPMEVAPTAHYSMGGVLVEARGHSTIINGLFACGEVAGGLHGANRLGGNSLAEILVFGKITGKQASIFAKENNFLENQDLIKDKLHQFELLSKVGKEDAQSFSKELKNIMWEYCGVIRDSNKLNNGKEKIDNLEKRLCNNGIKCDDDKEIFLRKLFDIRASLMTSKATIISAIAREESRGSHQRSDYPELNSNLKLSFHVYLDNEKHLVIKSVFNQKIKPALEDIVNKTDEIKITKDKLIE